MGDLGISGGDGVNWLRLLPVCDCRICAPGYISRVSSEAEHPPVEREAAGSTPARGAILFNDDIQHLDITHEIGF